MKKRPRGNVSFVEDEDIINPEDVDPSIGRFRNLVTTAVISNGPAKRPATGAHPEPPRKVIRPGRDFSFVSAPTSTTLGISLNAAPDLDLYSKSLPKPGLHAAPMSMVDADEPHKKKYAKEAWPGRKPSVL